MSICFNYQSIIRHFYEDNKMVLNTINEARINELKEKAKYLNNLYKCAKMTRLEKYCKKMERIQTSVGSLNDNNKIATKNSTEKFLLFMFCIDPNFEAFLIHSTYNTTKEIKYEMINTFGVYDPYLVKIERHFINYFLKQEEKDKINEEIERRVFK